MTEKGKTINKFKELYEIDVSDYVEKKGKFSYLSWAYAWKELKTKHPDATCMVHKFGENHYPYLKTDLGYFVEVTVTVNGQSETELLPVLDNYNKVIENPTAFHINTSIKRCKTKAIGLHGLGLKLWLGEDLPVAQEQQQKPKEKNEWEKKLLEQANNNESLLIEISDSWNNGIKSEKQYYWFCKQLLERNYK